MIGAVLRRAGIVGGLALTCLLVGAAGAVAQLAFTPVPGSPFAIGSVPISVAFSPSGLLATANFDDSTVSLFSVSPGGALTSVAGSLFAAGSGSPCSCRRLMEGAWGG